MPRCRAAVGADDCGGVECETVTLDLRLSLSSSFAREVDGKMVEKGRRLARRGLSTGAVLLLLPPSSSLVAVLTSVCIAR